jgi:Gpi18-like mannosyltransferase
LKLSESWRVSGHRRKKSVGEANGGRDVGAGGPAPSRVRWQLILISAGVAIAVRIAAILVAPQTSYLPDHISNMGWSTYAMRHGPWHIYELPANQPLVVRMRNPRTGQTGETVGLNAHACNYPPLSVYLFWLQGAVWHALDHNPVTQRPSRYIARNFGVTQPITSRVVDTRASRFADAFPGIVFDFLLAWGVAALVRALRPGRRSVMLEALAFAITLLAPPIFLDSSFWNQADSWVTSLLVWCLVFLMRQRLVAAGLLYGAAVMTKPQAVLFAPVFIYVFFALRFMSGGTWRRALGLWKTVVTAGLVVGFVAAPFMIADARSETNPYGAFRWFQRSYLGTIGAQRYQRTTLHAFNIWWLDLLAQGAPRAGGDSRRFLDADARLLGVSKATVGKALLALGVVLGWILCARKWKWTTPSWPACTFVILLAAFVLPTSVHERYIYYCMPVLIALAVHERKWIAPLVALLVVGTAEMTSFRWVGTVFEPGSAARGISGLLAVLSVLSLLYAYVVLMPKAALSGIGK